MYCPSCGAQNVGEAKYCRACGADISLVPQALARTLPGDAAPARRRDRRGRREKPRREKEPPTFERGLSNVFKGVALLLIVAGGYFYYFGAVFFWVWFLIPALGHVGEGIGQMIRAGREPQALPPHAPPQPLLNSPRDTSEIASPPASITEGTTRHLDPARR